jgi:hypothetical protein
MDTATPTANRILFLFCGVAFAAPTIFFAYYTARLIYVNLATEDAASHRSIGMLIGAIAFPLAAIICGLITRFFIKRGLAPQK